MLIFTPDFSTQLSTYPYLIYKFISFKGVCSACKDLIKGCKVCSSSSSSAGTVDYFCKQCEDGLFPSSDYKECIKCDPSTAPDKYLDKSTNTCRLCSIAIPSCEICDGNPLSCKKCSTGLLPFSPLNDNTYPRCTPCDQQTQIVKNEVCILCEKIFSNCNSCSAESCLSCKQGYYILQFAGKLLQILLERDKKLH